MIENTKHKQVSTIGGGVSASGPYIEKLFFVHFAALHVRISYACISFTSFVGEDLIVPTFSSTHVARIWYMFRQAREIKEDNAQKLDENI